MVWWDSKKVVTLEITSWVGSIGAIHYYGKLCCSGDKISVSKKLTTKEAKELNRCDMFKSSYLPSSTDRLKSPNEIRKLAKKQWKRFFPEAVVLLEGMYACCDPQIVLVAPREAKECLNDLYDETERIGGWDGDEKAMKKICKQWDVEMEKLVK